MTESKKIFIHKYYIFFLTLAVFVVYVIFSVFCETYLYLDGANYFTNILSKQKYMLYPLGRYTFDYITQSLAVVLIKSGVRNARTLGFAYGFGMTIWTAIFACGSSFLACRKKCKKIIYACFLSETAVILIWGSFPQQESILGFSLFMFILTYALLYEPKDNIIVHMCAVLASVICYHMNEYYCVWASILSFIFMFRYIKEKKFSFILWPLLSVWNIFVAITSYLSISGRGEVPDAMETFRNIIAYKYMVIVLALLVMVYLLGFIKGKAWVYGRIAVAVIYVAFNLVYILVRGHHIFNFGVASRFLILPMGASIALFLFVTTWIMPSCETESLSKFCSVHAALLILLVVLSYTMNYQFNSALLDTMTNSSETFVKIDTIEDFVENDKLAYYYRNGFIGYHGEAVLAVRGETEIRTILVNSDSWISKGNAYDINSYRNLEQYGIFFSQRFFSDNE